jgi:RNA polymerase sigma-70 factor (ECF subfamily)
MMAMGSSSEESRSRDDEALLSRLRAGDEVAFADVVRRWSPVMLRVARGFVSNTATAQDVVQEAWTAVIRGLDRFEGRSSLRTWVLAITANLARGKGISDARVVPFASLSAGEPAVDPNRFRSAPDPWAGGWTSTGAPAGWAAVGDPEGQMLAAEVRATLREALNGLPDRQRTVVALRDVHGLDSREVCEILGVSEGNQRILLHRGRSRLRQLLEDHFSGIRESA